MSDIKLIWYGHSCFQAEYENKSVVFDPYQDGSVPGLTLPKNIMADAVYCSHNHSDHNAAALIHVTGSADPFPTWKITVPHDDTNGTKRGVTDIRFVQLGHCLLAHLGDIGRMPTEKEYNQLKKADILLIPAGGYFTINAWQVFEIIKQVNPKLAVLMHYRNGWGYDVLDDIEHIQKVITNLKVLNQSNITFDEDTIPTGVMVMKPLQ